MMRRLISAAARISELGYNDTDDVEGTLRQAEDALFAVRGSRQTRGFVPLRQIYDQYLQDRAGVVEPLSASTGPVMSGFAELDELLTGLQRSDLIILGARPRWARAPSPEHLPQRRKNGSVAGVFSLEMSCEQLGMRILASGGWHRHPPAAARAVHHGEEQRMIDAIGQLSDLPMYIDDTPYQSMVEMRSKGPPPFPGTWPRLLVVDYLQLVQGQGRSFSANRVQEISEISRSLKALARDLNVALVALLPAQQAGGKPPQPPPGALRPAGQRAASSRTRTW